jgi:SAM-dependent methyltransferase
MNKFSCRSCQSESISEVLSLGRTPLANSLVDNAETLEATYPLDLVFCRDCALLQITETVPPEVLFGHYLYFSSFSDTMVAHARELATRMIAERGLGTTSTVIEAASNDGYLLQHYARAGVGVLGIEPAANIAAVAERDRGVRTLCEFFGAPVASRLAREGTRADVFHAHNVLAHVADLNGFVAGIRSVLKDDGVAIVEAPQAREMIERLEFDTIYHEHLCYFSLSALTALFERHSLRIVHAEEVAIHGGTIRIFAEHFERNSPQSSQVKALLEREARLGMKEEGFYKTFSDRVAALKIELKRTLAALKQQGHRIAAYGAAAKGSTLLNYSAVGAETLDFVADRSTYKQGKLMPGVHVPIVPPERLLTDKPDYVLLLVWNFADEVLKQQSEFRKRGGKFILPVPSVSIV